MKTTSTPAPDDLTLKEKLTYAAVGLVVLGGSFFLGRAVVRSARATGEQKKTYDEKYAAAFAQQLKMAFENDNYFHWGTDEEAVRTIIRKVPTKEAFKKVIQSYQKLYARSLMQDLKEELSSTEYTEMLAIIGGKPDGITWSTNAAIGAQQYLAWAKRLEAAFNSTYWGLPGTDEEGVKAVILELPTQGDFQKVKEAYQREYGRDLTSALKSELAFWEYAAMMELLNKKPKV